MPTETLSCGCTLDTDFVSPEHLSSGPPFHVAHKGPKKAPEPLPEPEDTPEEKKPKKK